jgi:hypothetical protein
MTGSGIFAAGGEVEEDETASVTPIRPPSKNYQVPFSAQISSFQRNRNMLINVLLLF